ncbi:hypothetical protein HWV23_10600 [Natronomonas halophila]|uniref:hypothetical protein n=1 Tax=Natronomonas halophila TaxID=2747817 RepID=UPI0015B55CD2|nr:hypothetical protein [Natronomonas halophila]QLD86154.1 hypothetical protein HWV23_10600 [Natronomonas halophila]
MFGISEPNILEQGEAGDQFINEDQPQVRITRNQTDPNWIVDGVDSIEISYESNDRFRVEYWGYMTGRLWITHDGVNELKQTFLDDRDEIPGWTLSTELTELPDWFPVPDDIPSPVTCSECGSEVSVTEVTAPLSGGLQDRYCPDCWSSVRDGT